MLQKSKAILPLLALAAPVIALATDVQVKNVSAMGNPKQPNTLNFQVEWKNGWRNERNWDGVWVFTKFRIGQGGWRHLRIGKPPTQGNGLARVGCDFQAPADGAGFFAYPGSAVRGDLMWNVSLPLGFESPARENIEFKVFAIEMVHIPEGPYSIGDPDPEALKYAAFYKSGADGKPDGAYRVTGESPITVGPQPGNLYYQLSNMAQYEGDRGGPVPQEFPKGFQGFWLMKYELSQGQYTDFLNNISHDAAGHRSITGVPAYTSERGTIAWSNVAYKAEKPNRPANFVSWDDACGFADWAGLRPMTELEFTKAARGPGEPIAHEYPWNTNSYSALLRAMQPTGDLMTTDDADESKLTEATRPVLGASYYWVMDLAGSVWERCVSIGHPAGRAFKGSHGDGQVTYGFATNPDWPKGDADGGGYGYRGGGYYEMGMTFGDFNPYSPIDYRRYGAWGGAPRSIAYGFRAARSD